MEQGCLQLFGTGFLQIGRRFLGDNYGTQTQEQHYHTFSNLALRGKLRKSVQFIYEQETEVDFLLDKLASNTKGFMDKAFVEVEAGKYPAEQKIHCSTLETHK